MLMKFVEAFNDSRKEIKKRLGTEKPINYLEVLTITLEEICKFREFGNGVEPRTDNIREVDDGDYQGTLLFLITTKGYQPDTYYITKVSYGSCSGCDTLQGILDCHYDKENPYNEEQANQFLTLALHMIQNMFEV